MPTENFTTGPATLPDIGECSYNTCTFSPLFQTQVSCEFVQDEAKRTTKGIQYTLTVDGYVTLPDNAVNIENTLATMEKLLSAPGGKLFYSGHGVKISVNTVGGDSDVSWGPHPEILEIVPLGGGRSAKIKWTVKTTVPPRLTKGGGRLGPVLQFNYETAISYDEAGYSTVRISGITEIPLTRLTPTTRTLTSTVDDFRYKFPGELLSTINLEIFRITRREFHISRDKRTMVFDIETQEHPWMAMPPDVTVAKGQFTFRPVKQGAGLANWLCSLNVTYTIPKGRPRRIAWFAFLALLRHRMKFGDKFGEIPPTNGLQNPVPAILPVAAIGFAVGGIIGESIARWRQIFQQQNAETKSQFRNVFLIDFSGSEGLYLDSQTVTFSATWRLVTLFSSILLASGLWRKVPQFSENMWATSIRDISGHESWLNNRIDPAKDAIVDFGS